MFPRLLEMLLSYRSLKAHFQKRLRSFALLRVRPRPDIATVDRGMVGVVASFFGIDMTSVQSWSNAPSFPFSPVQPNDSDSGSDSPSVAVICARRSVRRPSLEGRSNGSLAFSEGVAGEPARPGGGPVGPKLLRWDVAWGLKF